MDLQNTFIANKKNIIFAVVVLVLLAAIAFLSVQYVLQAQELQGVKAELATKKTNAEIVKFLNLFIEKVLKANSEVSFDDRLKLENAIRDLDDPVLLQKWEKFTSGTNATQIQDGVKDLLQALVNKITY